MSKRIILNEEAAGLSGFATQLPNAAEAPGTKHRRGHSTDARREASFKEGYSAGYAGGFEVGMNEAKQEEQRRTELFVAEISAAVARMESAMDLWYQKAEHGLAVLAKEIASKIICEELQTRPEVILNVVRDALGRVSNSTHARVRLNPFDLPTINHQKDALLQACQSIHEIDLVADDTLSIGSTVIESDSGVIDARVESKLTEIVSENAA